MITGVKREQLTLENILKKTDEYSIYRYYLGHDFKLGKKFKSPRRSDSNPSMCIFCTKSGILYHVDFGDPTFRGTCIGFVQQLFGLNYNDALKLIDKDLCLGISKSTTSPVLRFTIPEIKPRVRAELHVDTRAFSADDLRYWRQFHITEVELVENDIHSIRNLYLNRWLYRLPANEPHFAYGFGDYLKIYSPLSVNKWLSSVPIDVMSGLDKISPEKSKKVIIAKAKKDEIVLRKFVSNVCSVQNESVVSINEGNIKMFQDSYEETTIAFDSDVPGVENCKYYNQFGFGYINVPKSYYPIKDFADLAKEKGLREVEKVLKSKGII